MNHVVGVLDTSVLCELFGVPGKAQRSQAFKREFNQRVARKEQFALPLAAIVETGNFIGQVSRSDRRALAQRFIEFVRRTLVGSDPTVFIAHATLTDPRLLPLRLPEEPDVVRWLDQFPDWATRGIGFGDLTIFEEYRRLCRRFAEALDCQVYIWSKDTHLHAHRWQTGEPLP